MTTAVGTQPGTHTLLLNADFRPLGVITWQRAFILLYEEKAELIEHYADLIISTTRELFEWPAVVRLKNFAPLRRTPKFNRANILSRDDYSCQYCGKKPKNSQGDPLLVELTLDHVVPRAHTDEKNMVLLPWSGERVHVTCWRNIVSACRDCNWTKADRTPDQAKMKLRKLPKAPGPMDILRMKLTKFHIPSEWQDYLPRNSGWRNYWEAELT